MKNWSLIVIVLLLIAVGILATKRPTEVVKIKRYTDTVIIRDTVEIAIKTPTVVYITRVDTIEVELPGDTIRVPILLPIERKEYKDKGYHAIIEGYRADLVGLTLFPEIKYITNTEIKTITKRNRWGLGVQLGYGITPSKIEPYIGLGVSYNIWTW